MFSDKSIYQERTKTVHITCRVSSWESCFLPTLYNRLTSKPTKQPGGTQLTFQLTSGNLSSPEPWFFSWAISNPCIEKKKTNKNVYQLLILCHVCNTHSVLVLWCWELKPQFQAGGARALSTFERHTQPATFLQHSLLSQENLFLAFVTLIGLDERSCKAKDKRSASNSHFWKLEQSQFLLTALSIRKVKSNTYIAS